jgi:hypothetical protein
VNVEPIISINKKDFLHQYENKKNTMESRRGGSLDDYDVLNQISKGAYGDVRVFFLLEVRFEIKIHSLGFPLCA